MPAAAAPAPPRTGNRRPAPGPGRSPGSHRRRARDARDGRARQASWDEPKAYGRDLGVGTGIPRSRGEPPGTDPAGFHGHKRHGPAFAGPLVDPALAGTPGSAFPNP